MDNPNCLNKNLPIPFEPVLAKIYVKGPYDDYTYAEVLEHNGEEWIGEGVNAIKDGGKIQQWIYIKDIFK